MRASEVNGPMSTRLSATGRSATRGSMFENLRLSQTIRSAADIRAAESAAAAIAQKALGHTRSKRKVTIGEDWGCLRIAITRFQEHPGYKLGMGIVIVVNLALMVMETDHEAAKAELPLWMVVCSWIFSLIYVFDLFMSLFSLRLKFWKNGVNMIDFCIVSIDVITLPLSLVIDMPGSASILRTFRILRVVKVLNSVLAFRELYLMVQGLMTALRSIAFGTAMIALMLTIWSILAVSIIHPLNLELHEAGRYGDCGDDCALAFSTVVRADLTFLSTIVAGDSWGKLNIPLMIEYPYTGLIIIPAFLTVQLGLVNVIAAVIVDRQQQARVDDESLTHAEHLEELRRSYSRLQALFARMDEDGGGSLTMEEIAESYDQNPDFREMLDMMDITRKDIPLVFEILDADGSGDVTYDEFVEKLHYIRHINPHTLLVFVKQHMEQVVQNTTVTREQVHRLLHGANAVQNTDKAALRTSLRGGSTRSSKGPLESESDAKVRPRLFGSMESDADSKVIRRCFGSVESEADPKMMSPPMSSHNHARRKSNHDATDNQNASAEEPGAWLGSEGEGAGNGKSLSEEPRDESTWTPSLSSKAFPTQDHGNPEAGDFCEREGIQMPHPGQRSCSFDSDKCLMAKPCDESSWTPSLGSKVCQTQEQFEAEEACEEEASQSSHEGERSGSADSDGSCDECSWTHEQGDPEAEDLCEREATSVPLPGDGSAYSFGVTTTDSANDSSNGETWGLGADEAYDFEPPPLPPSPGDLPQRWCKPSTVGVGGVRFQSGTIRQPAKVDQPLTAAPARPPQPKVLDREAPTIPALPKLTTLPDPVPRSLPMPTLSASITKPPAASAKMRLRRHNSLPPKSSAFRSTL